MEGRPGIYGWLELTIMENSLSLLKPVTETIQDFRYGETPQPPTTWLIHVCHHLNDNESCFWGNVSQYHPLHIRNITTLTPPYDLWLRQSNFFLTPNLSTEYPQVISSLHFYMYYNTRLESGTLGFVSCVCNENLRLNFVCILNMIVFFIFHWLIKKMSINSGIT